MASVNFGQHAEIEKGQSQDGAGRYKNVGCIGEQVDGCPHDGCQNAGQDDGKFAAAKIKEFKETGIKSDH